MNGLFQDVRYALRQLRKNPGFTFLAVLCLALGIGVNTSVFTVLNFTLLRPLPVNRPERMTVASRDGSPLFAYSDYVEYRERNQAFTGLAASLPTESSIDADGETHLASAEVVSGNYSQTMGISTVLGRWFTDENEPVAVLSYATWQRFFNCDPHVLGKRVRSESQYYTVIGVANPEFTGIDSPIQTAIWVPLRSWTNQYPRAKAALLDRVHPWPLVMVFGRMKPYVSVSAAAVNLNSIDVSVRNENEKAAQSSSSRLTLEVIHGAPNPASRRGALPFVKLLFAVVGVVLLIACVNVGNLLLARGVARERELSVRASLGATRVRLLRQLLLETMLLSLLGSIGGIVLGQWTNRLLNALLSSLPVEAQLAFHLDLSMDVRVFGFALGLSFLCALLCGLFPAWQAVRRDPYPVLKGGIAPARRARLRHVSLVAQVALSLLLLLCAGMFLHSIYRMRATDPGFAAQNRFYALTYVSQPEFSPATGLQFYNHTLEDLRRIPGVQNAALTRFLPLLAAGQETDCVSANGNSPLTATFGVVSPGFLATMEIPFLQGRDFLATDGPSAQAVVIVSDSLARRLWSAGDVVGQRLRFGCDNPTTAEVVGVVRDTKVRSLDETAQPHFYRPFAQRYTGLATLVVETSGESAGILSAIRSTVHGESAGVRLYALEPVTAHVERSYWMVRWETSVLLVFGVLAVVLAAVGLYGAMSFRVSQRTGEIGVRMALGAPRREVYTLILFQGVRITLLGIVLGLGAFVGVARLLSRFLSGLRPTDPLAFLACAVLWLGVALLACYMPARRASKVDPMVALRWE